ncbi:hypothetical protein [Marinobacter algicola]|uniref:Lipoprotein n=1 Tax=Marinobacter algicola DG893 TaxID=443152 RepID=A6F4A8_9GAMM|nr:hypothetical protein [Marinobacter algicola]EDM46401.1 hypothetical protein MDG893_13099 [Marinobacter algicola DG893]
MKIYIGMALVVTAAFLAGCKAEFRAKNDNSSEDGGIYEGLVDTGREISFWTKPDGDFHILLGQLDAGQFRLSGVILGEESWRDGDIYTENASRLLFDRDRVESLTVDANIKSGQSITGLIGGTSLGFEGFTARYDSVSDEKMALPESQQKFRGNYTGYSRLRREIQETIITFQSAGRFSGQAVDNAGCRFNGKMDVDDQSPFFSMRVTFVEPDCVFSSRELEGSALYSKGEGRLVIVLPLKDRSGGAFFHGFSVQ